MISLNEIIEYLFSPRNPTFYGMLFIILITIISNYNLLRAIRFHRITASLIAILEIPIIIYLTTGYFYYVWNAQINGMDAILYELFVPAMLLVTIPIHILIWLRWKYKYNKKNKSI